MELMLIRHFKTGGNIEGRYVGRTDESILAVTSKLPAYPPVEMVIASPMKRCLETAALLYKDQPPVICAELRECDFGLFEMKNYEELKHHPAYREWLSKRGAIPFPGGECPRAFKERCVRGFVRMMELLLESGCGRAALVVHGGTIMAVLEHFDAEGRDFYHWQVDQGGYRAVLREAEWLKGHRCLREIERL